MKTVVVACACVVLLGRASGGAWSRGDGGVSYDNCDSDSVPDSVKATSLTPNTFYKICPGTRSEQRLGRPMCGDTSAFSFLFTRPPQRFENSERILIELQGGGACWNADTCSQQQDYLTFPSTFNAFVGSSCSEAQAALQQNSGKFPVSLLCARSVGAVDFTSYNMVVVPYCTQDVHLGDGAASYAGDNDDGVMNVRHHGGHNLLGVVDWLLENFDNPAHIALTGCSAGGTAVPVLYDLLNQHYNSGLPSVAINSIIDSPVYLTPYYFLHNSIDGWNPWTILGRTRFNYNKYRYDTDYPTKLWEHIVRRGGRHDSWGVVTHAVDPVSIAYWEWMSDNYTDGADDDYAQAQWSDELFTSLHAVEKKHSNVQLYVMDEEQGHCSFGLYYPLQESAFEQWAGDIFRERRVMGRTATAVPLFFVSILFGCAVVLGVVVADRRRRRKITQSFLQGEDETTTTSRNFSDVFMSLLLSCRSCPISIGYLFATTFYLFTMLVVSGMTHPLNNPSLGPSAVTLSAFGINNPTLIVLQFQIYRLFTSTFLCSGILTYLMLFWNIIRTTRHLEETIKSHKLFTVVCLLIGIGCNLSFATFGDGASCSSIPFILGLNTFSISMNRRSVDEEEEHFPIPWTFTILCSLFTILFLPFNSWIMLLSAMVIGAFFAPLLLQLEEEEEEVEEERKRPIMMTMKKKYTLVMMPLRLFLLLYLISFFIVMVNHERPNAIYKNPYWTGCNLIYSTNVSSFLEDHLSSDDDDDDTPQRRRRFLEDGGEEERMCAQLCIPHCIHNPLVWSAGKMTGYALHRGSCDDHGYTEHVADHTFTYGGYPLDIDLYYATTTYNDDDATD